MTARPCFLSHFVICLACAGAAFFAYQRGIFQAVYEADASMMTSAIAALFVVTAVWLGWQAWRSDSHDASADWGHLAEGLAVKLGLIGTGVGIILTIKAALASANPLSALQTAFFSMICGVAASAIIAVMTFSLELGIRRAAR